MKKQELEKLFVNPGAQYRGKPFWSWNGELRETELKRQVGVMKEMGLGGYFMHSRAGLITEYLGDEWFDLINAVADEGEKQGMEAWLYDEDRWPSGSAGGKVTVDPQYRMKSLVLFEMAPEAFRWDDDTLLAFVARIDDLNLGQYQAIDADTDVPALIASLGDGGMAGEWRVLRFAIVPDACSSGYNGTTYIDTMSYKAVYKFIELTHEEYLRRCGDRIGRSIKGIFTDEPHRGHCMDNLHEENGVLSCSMAWTDDLFEEFRLRYGYDARPILPELFYRKNGEKLSKIKLHYIDLANNLFIERFAMPINQWCRAHGIEFTGHVLHEDSLTNQTVPNGSLMRFYQYMGIPGVDVLTEGNRCYWIVKQLASAARQLGKKWMLSELYGCTGWQFNFKSHKAVGDWQALFGINLRCQHLSWYTMEGESKRDYPASILHQSPWYRDYSYVESYFARLGAFMSEGKPICDVLVLNPIESVWAQAYRGWAQWISPVSPDVHAVEGHYTELFHMLTDNHIDFDYGEEQMMRELASIDRDADGRAVLRVGEAVYHTVVVSGMLTIRPTTLDLLRRFLALGGSVIFAGDVPGYVDAVLSEEPAQLASSARCIPFDEQALIDAVRASSGEGVTVSDCGGTPARDVFVQLRGYENGLAAALLNTDREKARNNLTITFDAPAGSHVELWCPETGKRYDADGLVCRNDGRISVRVNLEAAGMLLLMVSADDEQLPVAPSFTEKDAVTLHGEYAYTLSEPNVCVLDFARWKWDDHGDWHEEKEALKVDQQIRDEVGIEHRGGEMLQPWFAKLHYKQKYGDITLEYRFNIEKLPQTPVFLAGERPEFNEYSINGRKLEALGIDEFWIDDCFKKMAVPADALHLGENVVTVKTNFMRTTNVEAVYLVGDFGVSLNGHRSTLTALPEKIGNQDLCRYNLPFYTGAVTWHIPAEEIAALPKASDGERILLSPQSFTGGLMKVRADGGEEQILAWDPYEADVTDAVREGRAIDVTVVGTRRNTFGPLHLVPVLHGAYGPGHFVTGGGSWNDDYQLLDSAMTGLVFKRVESK